MFYELKKGGELVERFNAKVAANGDVEAIARAKEVGADYIVTSAGKVVVIPAESVPVAPPVA